VLGASGRIEGSKIRKPEFFAVGKRNFEMVNTRAYGFRKEGEDLGWSGDTDSEGKKMV